MTYQMPNTGAAVQAEQGSITIATFYHFADFADFADWRDKLHAAMLQHGVKGSVLLAPEGINATIAGEDEAVHSFLEYITADIRFSDMFVKYSYHSSIPFDKAKVRLKRETITLNKPTDAACVTGEILSPWEWNKLIEEPDVLVLDTRNSYETHLGTFAGAQVWPLNDFQEITNRILREISREQKIAMFCTGGVRCEKLSSWLLLEGYKKIYQLEGGIIHYLNVIPEEESKWMGSCYVFDDRVAVGHGNKCDDNISLCPNCGHALTAKDRNHPDYLPAIHCSFCPF